MKQLLFKIGDAAKMLAISEGYLYELMSRDEIEYVKLGRKATRFTQKQLDDFIQQRVAKAERRKKKAEFTVNWMVPKWFQNGSKAHFHPKTATYGFS